MAVMCKGRVPQCVVSLTCFRDPQKAKDRAGNNNVAEKVLPFEGKEAAEGGPIHAGMGMSPHACGWGVL